MSEMSEMYNEMRERKREMNKNYREVQLAKDKALLDKLHHTHIEKIEDDGSGGEKYVIEVQTDRGSRIVHWWTSTGTWNVIRGKASGSGIYSMARYFQLIPRGYKEGDPI